MRGCSTEYARRPAILLTLSFLLLASCVPAGHRVSRDESFLRPDAARKPWRKVAVLPFTGAPAFRRVAGEWLAFRVRKHGLFEIVDPVLAGIELDRKGIRFGDAGVTVEEARTAGRLLGADGVVIGSVDQRPPILPGFPCAAAGVVDMATGRLVAESVRSYSPLDGQREESVMTAVDRVAEDLAPVFFAAAGRSWTPPRKEEAWPGPAEREPALR